MWAAHACADAEGSAYTLERPPGRKCRVSVDGTPARIVAPDPRWFALQKAWLSQQPKCNPLKRPKDARQARAIWAAVANHMPHYQLEQMQVPAELRACYEELQQSLHPHPREDAPAPAPRRR